MVLAKAETDNYFKYGIYAARILAVKHPEVYLKADDLFLETIQTNAGSKKAYEIDDVHSSYFVPWLSPEEERTGPPFSFDYVDFTKYQIIKATELYPENYPVLPYLDRRLLSVTSTLKSVDHRLTQLEKVEQYYFALKEKGATPDQLYLVYCDNENAYLYDQGKLIGAKDLGKVDQIEGNPILVFNEKCVWYPLMGRDDTPKDATLKQIVDKYATNVVIPKLSDFETQMVNRLVEATSVEGLQECVAIGVAAKSVRQLRQKFTSVSSNGLDLLIGQIVKCADYLSPIVAYLAAIGEEYEGEAKIEAICAEYVKHAATPGLWKVPRAKRAIGQLWMLGLTKFTIDDAYYTHAGHCSAQAAHSQAWLDISGVDSYRIRARIYQPTENRCFHVYIPEYDVVVDLGRFEIAPFVYHQTVLNYRQYRTGETLPNGVISVGYGSKWAAFKPIEQYCGT